MNCGPQRAIVVHPAARFKGRPPLAAVGRIKTDSGFPFDFPLARRLSHQREDARRNARLIGTALGKW